jgi:hypothetical protein
MGERSDPSAAGQDAAESALLAAQAAWYVGSGLWGVVAKRHYVETHDLTADPWIFRAHRAWLVLVGSVCAVGSRRPGVSPEARALAAGTATALALNDLYAGLREGSARIYAVDMAGEVAFLAGWAWSSRARLRGRRRGSPEGQSGGHTSPSSTH